MTQAAILAASGSPGTTTGFKNKIINGAMVIDQRGPGTYTPNASYTLDRWKADNSQTSKFTVQQNAGSVTPPVGFSNYLGVTSSSAYSVGASDFFFIQQSIEGFNTADLAWGTANAKTVTLSFQVYSSLTGTFGGAIRNSASNRSYPFSYTISSANTWTSISVTIAGDTSGTWIGATNGIGMNVDFSLGMGSSFSTTAGAWATGNYASATGATSVVGTSGATLYITAVQLEVGTTATNFDFRSYTNELLLCQRYYAKLGGNGISSYVAIGSGHTVNTNGGNAFIPYPVTMRTQPTVAYGSGMGVSFTTNYVDFTGAIGSGYGGYNSGLYQWSVAGNPFSAGQGVVILGNGNSAAYFTLSAEL